MKGEFISPIFLVPKKDGGSRPVINLKRLNSHIVYQHFKMEGLHLLKHIIQEKDFMIKIDLKDAYFCVPMSQQHQPFLRFIWGGTRYQFTCLPFGLAPAPLYFTKLLKPVVALLRRLGLRMIVYLDDIIVFNQTREGILRDRDSTLWLLQNLGFVINWKKSVLDPSHCMEYLGFVINSMEMNLSLPKEKMNQLIQSCRDRIREKTASVRTLAKIIGKLTSSMQAVLPAPLHYRHLQMLQLKGLLAGKSYDQGVRTRGLWSQQESNTLYINALELKAALFAVRAFTAKERQLHVHLRMDNRTEVAYVLKMGGTRSLVLVGIAQELWGYALTKQITLTAEYLPGKYNHEADWESRHFRDSSNWKLNPSLFQALDQLWGPLEIDLFADRLNAQLMNYVIWFPDPFAQATDAFQIPWSKLKGYSFPPFSMICRCLAKIRKDQATIVMITPTWHTQAWYPVLLEMSCRQPVLLPPLEKILMSPSQQPHPLVLQGSLQLGAWMVSGKTSLQKEFQSKLLSYSAPTPGARELRGLTIAPGHSGVAGVIREKLIHFAPLGLYS